MSENQKKYLLVDSGHLKKLEKFGDFLIERPASIAVWSPSLKAEWQKKDAIFSREDKSHWKKKNLPPSWIIEIEDIKFKLMPTDFGHLGVFPEHSKLFKYVRKKLDKKKPLNILNLFAYTGGITLAAAKKGASVCHVDASKPIISWAKENAKLNNLEKAPIRWIIDDVLKFLKREVKRKKTYDGIILDPPSFGRGPSGQVFKIEKDILPLLNLLKELLSKEALFLILSCHTPGFTNIVLENLLEKTMPKYGKITSDDLFLKSQDLKLPSGCFAIWEKK